MFLSHHIALVQFSKVDLSQLVREFLVGLATASWLKGDLAPRTPLMRREDLPENSHVRAPRRSSCKAASHYLQLFTAGPRLAEIKETALDIPVNSLKAQDEVFSRTSKTFLRHLTLCGTSCPPPAGTHPGQCGERTHGVTRANNTANTHRSAAPAAPVPASQHKQTRKSVVP